MDVLMIMGLGVLAGRLYQTVQRKGMKSSPLHARFF